MFPAVPEVSRMPLTNTTIRFAVLVPVVLAVTVSVHCWANDPVKIPEMFWWQGKYCPDALAGRV